MSDLYLIWSNEHGGWWKPGCHGYTKGLTEAGRFSRGQALGICRDSIPTAMHIGMISEIPVRLADVEEFLAGRAVPNAILAGSRAS
jgi:hypothetical protein